MKEVRIITLAILTLLFPLTEKTAFSQESLKILPLGNSITRGTMCTNGDVNYCVDIPPNLAVGYRKRLYKLLDQAGYNIDFIGSEEYGGGSPGMDDDDNAGFAGVKSSALADLIETGKLYYNYPIEPGPYLNYHPAEIILLHIGTNDVYGGLTSVSHVNRLLDAVDDYEASIGKPVLVFVAKIISWQGYDCHTHPGTNSFNTNLAALVQSRKNAGDHLVLVDMECDAGIDYDVHMTDQLHPTIEGYEKMAELWFQEIDNFNSAPMVSQIPNQTKNRGTAFDPIHLDTYVDDFEDQPSDIYWTTIPANPEHFTISIDQSRIATVTPKDPNWSGTETIEFVGTDRGRIIEKLKKSDASSTSFTLNWIPEISGQNSLSTAEETAISIEVSDLILTDQENAPGGLTLELTDGADYNIIGNTVFPGIDFNGTLSVPVKVIMGETESNTWNLQISVSGVNDPPVITGPATEISTKEDSCLILELEMLEVEDTDDNYPHGFTITILPGDNYSFNGLTVCPATDYTGVLEVNVKVNDGEDDSGVFPLEINILASKPVFLLPSNLEAIEDQVYSEGIELDHYDPESFEYSVLEKPEWLEFDATGKVFSGIPENSDVGLNYVVIEAVSPVATADTAFYIEVINVNDPPLISSSPLTTAKSNIPYSYRMIAIDIDPDEVLFYNYVRIPSWAGFSSSKGTLQGTPTRSDVGLHQVSLTVTDGEVTVPQDFIINVEFHNYPPEIITEPKDTAEINTVYTYGIHADDFENDPVSYFVRSKPDWLEFYPATGVLIGTPLEENFGAYLIAMGATDGIDSSFQAYRLEVVLPTSIAREQHQIAKVYPNPASTILSIEIISTASEEDPFVLEIYDISGKKRVEKQFHSDILHLDLTKEKMKSGLYFYRISPGGKPNSGKTGKLLIK